MTEMQMLFGTVAMIAALAVVVAALAAAGWCIRQVLDGLFGPRR
ncbi:hypothetical protein MYOV003v1_p0002 [Vibrio phage 207E48.1]|nr:hypothetical protein MYOV003v1_p0002 [Vibrio phage 207E48.1]